MAGAMNMSLAWLLNGTGATIGWHATGRHDLRATSAEQGVVACALERKPQARRETRGAVWHCGGSGRHAVLSGQPLPAPVGAASGDGVGGLSSLVTRPRRRPS